MDPSQYPPRSDGLPPSDQQSWGFELPHHFLPIGGMPDMIPQNFDPGLVPRDSHNGLNNLASAAAISNPYHVSEPPLPGHRRSIDDGGPSAFIGNDGLASSTSAAVAQQREQTRARRRVPSSQRKRTQISCDACKTRRCKCVRLKPPDGNNAAEGHESHSPCKLCTETGIACVTTMPRKQRVYGSVENLDRRYRALEALVSGLFPDLNPRASAQELISFGRERAIAMPDFSDSSSQVRSPSSEPSIKPNPSEASSHGSGQLKRRRSSNLVFAGTDQEKTVLPPSYLMRFAPVTTPQTKASPADSVLENVAETNAERTGLILDATGRPHYIGPCGSLAFFAKMRELFSQRLNATTGPGDPGQSAGNFKRDRTGQFINNPLAASLGGTGDRGRGGGSPSGREHPSSSHAGPHELDHLEGDSPPQICENMLKDHPNDPEFWRYRQRISKLKLPPRERADACLQAFFRFVHPNYILFHRLTFQGSYEKMWRCWDAHRDERPGAKEIAVSVGWLCCLYMMFVLGSRALPQDAESLEFQRKWFAEVDKLPPLLGTSSLPNVCAYMLLSLYYHNTNDRTSAWTFHGAACRLSIALGMHRESASGLFDPLERQLRKLVWWTLYEYEQFLCCSLGRPSAIDDREMDVGIPNDDYLDANLLPPRYIEHSARLNMLLAAVRRGIFDPNFVPEKMHTRALEFLETILQWEDTLPRGLRHDGLDYGVVGGNGGNNDNPWRSVALLHIRYQHTLTFLTRPFLFQVIQRCTQHNNTNNNNSNNEGPHATIDASAACKARGLSKVSLTAAMRGGELIIRMWRAGLVNGVTWLDLYYAYMSSLDISLALLAPAAFDWDEVHPEIPSQGLLVQRYSAEQMRDAVRQLYFVMSHIEVCGTNARFAKAAFEFASALGIATVDDHSLPVSAADGKAVAMGMAGEDKDMVGKNVLAEMGGGGKGDDRNSNRNNNNSISSGGFCGDGSIAAPPPPSGTDAFAQQNTNTNTNTNNMASLTAPGPGPGPGPGDYYPTTDMNLDVQTDLIAPYPQQRDEMSYVQWDMIMPPSQWNDGSLNMDLDWVWQCPNQSWHGGFNYSSQ